MSITNAKEFGDASDALKAWFKSQDISPHESMSLLAYFIAAMSFANARSWEDIERKLSLMNKTSTEFAIVFHTLKAVP